MNEQTLYFSWPALTEETANYLPHIHASVGETLLVQLPSRQGLADNTCLGHYPCLSGNPSQIRTWGICGSVSKPCSTEWESRWLSVCLRCICQIIFLRFFKREGRQIWSDTISLWWARRKGLMQPTIQNTQTLMSVHRERRAGLCRRAVCNQIGRAAQRPQTRRCSQYASRVRAYHYETLSHTHIQLHWLKMRGF